jgi:hypothetical protein
MTPARSCWCRKQPTTREDAPSTRKGCSTWRNWRKMKDEARYVCDSCGEEIVVPIDLSAGTSQEYVEDCPVCCRPNVVHVEVDDDGDVRVWAQGE